MAANNLQNFLNAGGLLPAQNVAARQAAISSAHPKLSSQAVATRANQQVFQSFKSSGGLTGLLPPPSTIGAIGQTQYTSEGQTNNGPTDPQLAAATGGGSSGTGDGGPPLSGLPVSSGTTASATGLSGFFGSLTSTQQTLLIVGIVGIGAFLLFREFKHGG